MAGVASESPAGRRSSPPLGQGTWRMGEDRGRRARGGRGRCALGIELGMTLIDTAEMYGEGGAEELVGEAIARPCATGVFLVSKVYPHNAQPQGRARGLRAQPAAARTDRLDLYLLHWRGSIPLAETVDGFERAASRPARSATGASATSTPTTWRSCRRLPAATPAPPTRSSTTCRAAARSTICCPGCAARGMPVMAYSPIEQGAAAAGGALAEVAQRHGATPYQVALAWVLRRPGVIAIPKAATAEHVRENRRALDIALDEDDLAALDRAFPPPKRKKPLEMI